MQTKLEMINAFNEISSLKALRIDKTNFGVLEPEKGNKKREKGGLVLIVCQINVKVFL